MATERDAKDHPEDVPRARLVAAGFLLGITGVGIVTNLAFGEERFSIAFCVACLTAALGLMGLSGFNLTGR